MVVTRLLLHPNPPRARGAVHPPIPPARPSRLPLRCLLSCSALSVIHHLLPQGLCTCCSLSPMEMFFSPCLFTALFCVLLILAESLPLSLISVSRSNASYRAMCLSLYTHHACNGTFIYVIFIYTINSCLSHWTVSPLETGDWAFVYLCLPPRMQPSAKHMAHA